MNKLVFVLPLLLCACNSPKNSEKQDITKDKDFITYVNACVETKFKQLYTESDFISIYTVDIENYWISDVYYKPFYQNDIYKTEYISAVNDSNELVIKEIHK